MKNNDIYSNQPPWFLYRCLRILSLCFPDRNVSTIPTVPIFLLKDQEFENQCSICLTSYYDDLIYLSDHPFQLYQHLYYRFHCNHLYHKKCFDKYIEYTLIRHQDVLCPLCRCTLFEL